MKNWYLTNIGETTVYLVISKRIFPKLDLHETRFYRLSFFIKGFSISTCLNMPFNVLDGKNSNNIPAWPKADYGFGFLTHRRFPHDTSPPNIP